MPRIRTIKPEFWRDEDLSSLSEATHLLAAALLNYADDEGYFNANPALIKAECSPLREPSVSIHESLIALSRIGFIELGNGPDDKRYGRIVNFLEHQRINRPTPSKINDIGIVWERSVNTHGGLTEPSLLERKGKEEEGKGDSDSSLRSESGAGAPPTNPVCECSIQSAEEMFWTLKDSAAAKKVTPSLMGKLAKACGGDFDAAYDALRLALEKDDPRAYIGAVIRQRELEAAHAEVPYRISMPDDPKVVPTWVFEARREGYEVRWTGKGWWRNGRLWDDEEQEIG